MFDLITIGSATQDVFVSSDQTVLIRLQTADCEQAYLAYEYGGKIAVEHLMISTGGGAVNTAIAFKKLGLRVAIIAEVGQDDAGKMIERTLAAQGVDTSLLSRNSQAATGFSVILTGPTGDRTVLVHRGAGSFLSREDIPWEILRQASWLYLGALSGEAAALWHEIARFVAETRQKLAINPGSPQLAEGLDGLADILRVTTMIFVNKTEAFRLTGITEQRGDADERAAAELLHRAGCREVVITLGAAGARAYDGQAHYFATAPAVPVVSNLGAGDAFAAACVAARFYGWPLPLALQAGAINAGGVISAIGATNGLYDWPTIQQRLQSATESQQ